MPAQFVHLHVHTDYSMLDGACRTDALAAAAAEHRQPAIACTDHGNMHAAVEFYQKVGALEVKPIVGCEFYVAPGSRLDRDSKDPHAQGFHLILLAENLAGYQNLCRLNTAAWTEGFYYKPRIDKEILAQHREGLLALSACIAGEVPSFILEGNDGKAVASLKQYLDIFGRHGFYLELQDHGLPEEATSNRRLVELAQEFGIGLVATNDAHYLKKEHWQAHDVLLCIGTQKTLMEEERLRFKGQEFYLKTAEEMEGLFRERPDALHNTLAIAERCNLVLPLGAQSQNHYPLYAVPDGQTREEYLRGVCVRGISERYGFDATAGNLTQEQRERVQRMDYEIGVIAKAGFTSYFLIVWDFLHFAKQNGIPVGPGRGSGAGSLVAYLTRITDIDPIRYGLLFERFLNPERVSPPDFDIDLCERRRHEVIDYVRGEYGKTNVAQIATFGTLKAKAVIKDIGRAMGRSFGEVNLLTQKVPADPKMTLKKALEESAELREMAESEEWVKELIRYALVLEGLNRNMSIHAAGVIIGDQPLSNLVPLGTGADDEIITQYSAAPCEALGLLKMDFLGLRTLTIIQDTVELIGKNRGIALDMTSVPLDNAAAYQLLNKGNTVAVFQLESGGFRELCRRFGVHRLEDIIALIALYRPGPMQFLDDFISRKMGQTPIEYDLPVMRPILAETYGIMLYQEQVMQVVQKVAGFSLGRADILRRAMGKKKEKEMAQQYEAFVNGCVANGVDREVADRIWEKITKFAGYGFNKSHSAAYAMLSYRTAYLKANYPVEFMAAVLSSELGDADALTFFLKECQEMGIEVKPPDVNISGLTFSVDKDCIRFGLAGVKGVGTAAAEAIIAARGRGRFSSLLGFCEAVADSKVNRHAIESLCRAGAFDCFGQRRSQIFALIDDALRLGQSTAADRAHGQGSLFAPELRVPDIPEWERKDLLANEKELLGFYVTGHPLTEYETALRGFESAPIGRLAALEDDTAVRIGGMIASLAVRTSKKDQRPLGVIGLAGLDGSVECLAFGDAYEKYAGALVQEAPVVVEGRVSNRKGEEVKVWVERVLPIEAAVEELTAEVHVRLHEASVEEGDLLRLQQVCAANPGPSEVVLCLICASGEIAFVKPDSLRVRNSIGFRQSVKDLFGEECLLEKAVKTVALSGHGPRNGRRPADRRPARTSEA